MQFTVADAQEELPVQDTRQSLPMGHVILACSQVSVLLQSTVQLLLFVQLTVADAQEELPAQDIRQSLSSGHVNCIP